MFTEKEIAYIKSQPLARLSTVANDGQPDAAAVGFEFDGRYFYITGYNLAASRKYKNIAEGNVKVALLIDDLESVQPWKARGIRIYGTVELVDRAGVLGTGTHFRITPHVSWSWSLEGPAFANGKFITHKTVHQE
jgi:pyridoxamine 5'-phosphate oxidase family protein